MWVKKYAPKSLSEYVNQKDAVAKFVRWYNTWKEHRKPCLLHGPPGVGKTSLVYAFAHERGLEVIELNASDFRDAASIKRVLSSAVTQKSLFARGKIFLIDEVDGIAGREDKGGVAELVKLVPEARNPIVFTANDAWDPKLKPIRDISEMIELKKLSVKDVEKKLFEILRKEGIYAEFAAVKQIAARNEGDLRGAINDLETVARGKKRVTLKDLEVLGFREREHNIFETMKIFFKTRSIKGARFALMNSDRDPEELMWWVENNIFNEYEKPEEIAKAYEYLALADVFRRRITMRQNWRLLVYMLDLIAAVTTAKREVYRKFTRYQYPERLKLLSVTKAEREEEQKKLEKLAKKLHCSTRKVKTEYLPYLKHLLDR
jgi:replication factor C large subunit